MLTEILTITTFAATADEWERIAKALDDTRERRLARTIRESVERQRSRYWRYNQGAPIPLRFRGGSIAKLREFIHAMERAANVPGLPGQRL